MNNYNKLCIAATWAKDVEKQRDDFNKIHLTIIEACFFVTNILKKKQNMVSFHPSLRMLQSIATCCVTKYNYVKNANIDKKNVFFVTHITL